MRHKTKSLIVVTALISVMLLTSCSSPLSGKNGSSNSTQSSGTSTSTSSQAGASDSGQTANQTGAAPSATASTDTSSSTSPDTTKKANGLQLSPGIDKIKVKALYLTGNSAGLAKKLDSIIQIANNTEINAVVIDVKEDGCVNYETDLEAVKKYGKITKLFKAEDVIKKLHDNGIYAIGRIVTFKDNVLARKRADLAVKSSSGSLWLENGKVAWANPYNEDVWDYNIAIAKDAIAKGFDEIQFDYVRFPTGKKGAINYGANPPQKATAINGFLAKANKELHEGLGVPVSADVFGIIIESKLDGESIGQRIEEVGKDIYCICPMIYPSHYANSSKGIMGNGVGQDINGVKFTKPDLEPYSVMYNQLLSAKKKISTVSGYKAKIRPYLQAFTASYIKDGYYQTYGPKQIKEQIKAIYDAGYEEWILWDARNKYQEAYFEKESK